MDEFELEPPLDVETWAADQNLTLPRSGDERDKAERYLRAAVRAVENRVGPTLPRVVTLHVARQWGRPLLLDVWPALAVETVDGAPVAPDVRVDDVGVVHGLPSGTHVLTVRVGRDPVPDDIVTGVFFVASHLWEMQRGRAGRAEAFARPDEATAGVPRSFAIPRRALELLAPYMVPGTA